MKKTVYTCDFCVKNKQEKSLDTTKIMIFVRVALALF